MFAVWPAIKYYVQLWDSNRILNQFTIYTQMPYAIQASIAFRLMPLSASLASMEYTAYKIDECHVYF